MHLLIEVIYTVAATLYCMIRRKSDGFVWNTALNGGDGGFEAWNAGNWAQYAIALTEQNGSGYYSAEYPEAIGAELTSVVFYATGGSPSSADAPPFILGAAQGQNVAAVAGVGQNAANMGAALSAQAIGAAVGTVPSALEVTTTLEETQDDTFLGRVIMWTSGAMAKQAARISAYNGSTKVISVLAWPSDLTPADGDEFVII